ncbi:hypothetical protein ACHHYP_05725 [Achlya hypogyna]|uniref:Uncharacterized protein n=1 Tax=Achlya hypogyna TaxID=1202772 RepID=A0A1V9YWU1_ACHHY|nr:hypothetical protein ACHHYP_05725 [Achlya hypogyna]
MEDEQDARGDDGEDLAKPLDDSVPIAFLLGDKMSFYSAKTPVKIVAQPRPRTPTDFCDMSKREREVRAKMVLDPIELGRQATFLTAVKGISDGALRDGTDLEESPRSPPRQSFQSLGARKQRERQRLANQRLHASIYWKGDDDMDTSHGFARPKTFLPVTVSKAPTLTDKQQALKVEVEKARAKVHFRMHHAQRVLEVTRAQQEFARDVLRQQTTGDNTLDRDASRKYVRQKWSKLTSRRLILHEKRLEVERRKQLMELQMAAARREKEASLCDLQRDVDERNREAKLRKVQLRGFQETMWPTQGSIVSKLKDRVEYFQRKDLRERMVNQYKLEDDDPAEDLLVELVPLAEVAKVKFMSNRRRPQDKYTIEPATRPKPVFGGGFHVAKAAESDEEGDDGWEESKEGELTVSPFLLENKFGHKAAT